jgi:hypothetical protein
MVCCDRVTLDEVSHFLTWLVLPASQSSAVSLALLMYSGKIIMPPHLFFILIAISQPCTLARSPLLAFINVGYGETGHPQKPATRFLTQPPN